MEEADALADRVGIISKRLLDVGSTQQLREKYGHGFSVHVVLESEPDSSEQEMKDFVSWAQNHLPGTLLEGFPYHGQLRLKISPNTQVQDGEDKAIMPVTSDGTRSVSSIFEVFEENKQRLGIKFYSVSPSTFDEVFLNVIGKHSVQEEDFHDGGRRWKFWRRK
jgi:ATP-binding cassette subfamily A (ABC1) protein 3